MTGWTPASGAAELLNDCRPIGVGDVIKGVAEDTTLASFETLSGQKLTLMYKGVKGLKPHTGMLIDSYIVKYDYDKYWYSFRFNETYGQDPTGFSLMASFGVSPGIQFDDANCLSLGDIKAMAQAAGWTFTRPFMGIGYHQVTAVKGRLTLEASAVGSAPENASEAEARQFVEDYGFKGCARDLHIRLFADRAKQ